ncbi:MAG: phage tail family protein [Candidatus Peribacteria bacterium]|jgi:phage-related protein|nr:phage tail family protein [Candidatus Peribacteria bacterium]
MNLKYNEILCSANSAMPTPARFIIKPTKIINAPLTIKKNHTGEHFSLDIDAKVGDVIVIDSKKKTATKN